MSKHYKTQSRIKSMLAERVHWALVCAAHNHWTHEKLRNELDFRVYATADYSRASGYTRAYLNGLVDALIAVHVKRKIGWQVRLDGKWIFSRNVPDGRHKDAYFESKQYSDTHGPSGRFAYLDAPDCAY